jgi:hypothetical protein
MARLASNVYEFVVYLVFLIAVLLIGAVLFGRFSIGLLALILCLGILIGVFSLGILIAAGVRIGTRPLRRQK